MAILDYFRKNDEVSSVSSNKGFFIYNNSKDKLTTESLQGEVVQDKITFPQDLGEAHPFDFSITEGLYKNFGLVTAVVDKHVDFIVGPGFWVESDNENASAIINQWMKDVNFSCILRNWLTEALTKGNAFLEIAKRDEALIAKVLDAKYMYVKRDKKGNIEHYNQYLGKANNYDAKKVNQFKKEQIAFFPYNLIGSEVYGLGIIYPTMALIDVYLGCQKEALTLLKRKANSPYWVKLGTDKIRPSPTDIQNFGKKLEYLNNKHEWVTGPECDIKVLDFGNLADKFGDTQKANLTNLIYSWQIPEVILGGGNIPEGLAKVQLDVWERRVMSIQEEMEKVIEQQIFKRILLNQGIDAHVEFFWGVPSSMQKNERLTKLTELLKLFGLNPQLKHRIEQDIAEQLGYDEELIQTPEEEREEEEEDIPQPAVPGVLRQDENVEVHENQCECLECVGDDKNYTLTEWLGFNYNNYLQDTVEAIREDEFLLLKAKNKKEVAAGMFTVQQVDKFRSTLEEGFVRGSSLKDISKNVDKRVKPKTLLAMKGGEILKNLDGTNKIAVGAANRAMLMTRSESTRMAAEGSLRNYTNNDIQMVKFVSASGSRTCGLCQQLYGRTYPITEARNMLPVHPNCFIDHQVNIYTSKGNKKIKDIKKGDLVLTHTGEFKKVTKLSNPDLSYKGEVVKIELNHKMSKAHKKGKVKSITVTPEHPLLTIDGWREAKDIDDSDELIVMAKICKTCNEHYPVLGNFDNDKGFCSLSCANSYTAKEQFKDEHQHKIRSDNARIQMIKEYRDGVRDRYDITKKANEKVREIGQPKLKGKPSWNKGLTKEVDHRVKHLSESCKGTRWNTGQTKDNNKKLKMHSEKMKKLYREHPEKHPNRIMAERAGNISPNYISKHQLEMFYLIKSKYNDAELEYPIKTTNSVRFADVAIPSLKLVCEFDGEYWHRDSKSDDIRTDELNNQGWTVIRFNKNTYNKALYEVLRIENNHSGNYHFISLKPSKIKKWALKKARRLYNFSVEDNESYIANNIVVHNCRCAWMPVTELT